MLGDKFSHVLNELFSSFLQMSIEFLIVSISMMLSHLLQRALNVVLIEDPILKLEIVRFCSKYEPPPI